MSDRALIGLWRYLMPVPQRLWQRQILAAGHKTARGIKFMTAQHHAVRNFVVRELPRMGTPLPLEAVAQGAGLPVEQTIPILDELERRLLFLVRNEAGSVTWAYPVTVDPTPHRVRFDSGEQLYAA